MGASVFGVSTLVRPSLVLTLSLVLTRRNVLSRGLWTKSNPTDYTAAYRTRETTNKQKLISHGEWYTIY